MSSGSESDEDFVPGQPEKLSEEESADEETDMQFEQELAKINKRKGPVESKEKTKKRKTRNGIKETNEQDEDKVEATQATEDPEEQKKKDEDLWAKFLEGTDTKPKAAAKQITASSNEPTKTVDNKPKTNVAKKDDDKARERRIFEFAGETIVVEDNVIKEKFKGTDSPASVSKLDGASRSRSGAGSGLSNVLDQLNKKNQLSTLEKSKLDWLTYKKEEGIEEEIQSHNKGKRGYLDRQDFLERADHRQYEIERDLRTSRRSNR